MAKGTVHVKAAEAKANSKDQTEFLASIPTEALPEVAGAFGVPEDKIPEDATREQLIQLIQAAKRHDISIAKAVMHDGKPLDCPIGYAIIRVTPKNDASWGKRSKEVFFVAMNGSALVGRRGIPVVIPEKYLSCFTDAVRNVYDQDQESLKVDYNRNGANLVESQEYAEDFSILAHAPDLDAARLKEEELKANSVKFLKKKAAMAAYKEAMYENNMVNQS